MASPIYPSPDKRVDVRIEGPDIVTYVRTIDNTRPRVNINMTTMQYEFNSHLISSHKQPVKRYIQQVLHQLC